MTQEQLALFTKVGIVVYIIIWATLSIPLAIMLAIAFLWGYLSSETAVVYLVERYSFMKKLREYGNPDVPMHSAFFKVGLFHIAYWVVILFFSGGNPFYTLLIFGLPMFGGILQNKDGLPYAKQTFKKWFRLS